VLEWGKAISFAQVKGKIAAEKAVFWYFFGAQLNQKASLARYGSC